MKARKFSIGFPIVAVCSADVMGEIVGSPEGELDGSTEITGVGDVDGDALGLGRTEGVGLFLCFLPTSDLAASDTPPLCSLATQETYWP